MRGAVGAGALCLLATACFDGLIEDPGANDQLQGASPPGVGNPPGNPSPTATPTVPTLPNGTPAPSPTASTPVTPPPLTPGVTPPDIGTGLPVNPPPSGVSDAGVEFEETEAPSSAPDGGCYGNTGSQSLVPCDAGTDAGGL